MSIKRQIAAVVLGLGISMGAMAAIEVYQFDNPEDETRYKALIEELRCPKCQNQNLAGSDAPIAQDLKQKTYEMIKDGRSDSEIRNYMFERYGDFISYKPPIRPSTWILWIFPPILLVILLLGWLYKAKKGRSQIIATDNRAFSESEQARLDELLTKYQTPDQTPKDKS